MSALARLYLGHTDVADLGALGAGLGNATGLQDLALDLSGTRVADASALGPPLLCYAC